MSKVWITRDKKADGSNDGDTVIWSSKIRPPIDEDGGYDVASGVIKYEGWAKDFKTLFGFTPRKGSCREYDLTLTERKEK